MGFKLENHRELSQITTKQDTALGIMSWGRTNAFPQTLINLIEQSPSAKPAVARTAKFYRGAGFEGESEIINSYGLTLGDLYGQLADDYSRFEAFAIQTDYNLKGQVVAMHPMKIAELRFNEFDELNTASKIGYHPNFAQNSEVQKTIINTVTREKIRWYHRYNPKMAPKQMEATEGKSGNYTGQILYFSESGFNSYPIPPLQSAINFVLSDVENAILVRKETATGFINSYILKTTLSSGDATLEAIQSAIEEAQGARGAGKVIAVTDLAPEDLNATLLEPIGAGNNKAVIESSAAAYELTKGVITGAYLIPPALAGIDMKTGFSGADLEEAYKVFNAITEHGRNTISKHINRILADSIFDTRNIEVQPLQLNLINKDGE